jgi:xylan 1,4-beta-xylosidase
MRPVVELGYMPRDLASEPSRTVFAYEGIISPPRDWDRWYDLVRAFTAHLADRYGRDELRAHWRFEVWNEPNLSVFWSGTPAEYWRLYSEAARAVKSVDPFLRVGGPATAAVGWIDEQLKAGAPVDFVSTHVYGTIPLDLRPLAGGRSLLWTEWGVTATHGSPINDSVFAAAFLLKGMRSAAGRVDALAPWVVSDHFEELGRPGRFLHGGFGLLTVGNLAKPKFWALHLAQRLGEEELPATVTGDGAGSLVEVWASRYADGGLGVLLWNSTLDHTKSAGDAELARLVRFTPPLAAPRTLRVWRVDADHGNLAGAWRGSGWPAEDEWTALREADSLPESEAPRRIAPGEEIVLELPNPGIAFLELRPSA